MAGYICTFQEIHSNNRFCIQFWQYWKQKHNLKKFGCFSASNWPVFFETAVVSLHYCTTTTIVVVLCNFWSWCRRGSIEVSKDRTRREETGNIAFWVRSCLVLSRRSDARIPSRVLQTPLSRRDLSIGTEVYDRSELQRPNGVQLSGVRAF